MIFTSQARRDGVNYSLAGIFFSSIRNGVNKPLDSDRLSTLASLVTVPIANDFVASLDRPANVHRTAAHRTDRSESRHLEFLRLVHD